MPLDPHVQRFLGMMAVGSPATPGVTTRRQGQRMIAQLAGPDSIAVERRPLSLALGSGPRPARLYIPEDSAAPGPASSSSMGEAWSRAISRRMTRSRRVLRNPPAAGCWP